MDRPRLIFVTNRFEPSLGGIERQSKLLAVSLAKRGLRVTVLTDRHQWDLPPRETVEGVNVLRVLSLWTLRRLLTAFFRRPVGRTAIAARGLEDRKTMGRRIRRFISYKLPMYSLSLSVFVALLRYRRTYDIIQVFQTNFLAFAAAVAGRIADKPVVAIDSRSGGMDELNDFFLPRTTTSRIKSGCTFVAISNRIERDLLSRGISQAKICQIPNAVELPPLPRGKSQQAGSALFVGNVYGDIRQKGLDVLLKGWNRVVTEVPGCRLTVVGVGDFSPFRALADEQGVSSSVEFVGAQQHMRPWYERCAVFVLPSRYEGMPVVLLEAMSFAKACVATNVSGSEDLIEHERNGLLVPVEDPDALARAIISLLKNHRQARRLGGNARVTVERRHTPEAIADQYLALYRTLHREANVKTSAGRTPS